MIRLAVRQAWEASGQGEVERQKRLKRLDAKKKRQRRRQDKLQREAEEDEARRAAEERRLEDGRMTADALARRLEAEEAAEHAMLLAKEQMAVKLIQSVQRGRSVRKRLALRKASAKRIQTAHRGRAARVEHRRRLLVRAVPAVQCPVMWCLKGAGALLVSSWVFQSIMLYLCSLVVDRTTLQSLTASRLPQNPVTICCFLGGPASESRLHRLGAPAFRHLWPPPRRRLALQSRLASKETVRRVAGGKTVLCKRLLSHQPPGTALHISTGELLRLAVKRKQHPAWLHVRTPI